MLHFQQPNGHQTRIGQNSDAYQGCLVVSPSTGFRAFFANSAQANSFLSHCPPGSSVHPCQVDWVPPAGIYVAGNFGNPHYAWPTNCAIVLANADQSFVGLFQNLSDATTFAAVQALYGVPCTAYTGSLQS